ncbi:MAG TPA: putative protein N(5)-glutamine methyltransferase [Jatrophihabitans sp.]|jgi:release factor glutamine methyltransferase|uniref:putative protein N(5)-glutamine methyltransferase n=1 Tax=Jatrophihabitans sp. TaxID=1932789 RepID=UPI002E03AC7F|nr:putative protein N(5)-glutamine methyltransferase [Jatrophihabitans sp.]
MPVTRPSLDTVVARLRAAGCVFAEDEAELLLATATTPEQLDAMLAARADEGRPLEVVLGWAEFCGLRILVDPGVFVPRRRSELLVREAAARTRPGAVVVDLCCGTAAIGLAVAAVSGPVDLVAADLAPAAVACARRNVGGRGRVFAGDLYAALPAELRGRVDVLVVNAPYVPTDEIRLMPPEARDHEPRITLDGGPDGLDVQRRIVAGAGDWLAPDGHLLIETSAAQAPTTATVFAAHGFRAQERTDDDLEATVVIGVSGRPGAVAG